MVVENNDISKQIISTTIRIDTQDKDGDWWSGTGFFIYYEKNDKEYPLLVTNKHVIKDMVKAELTFLKMKDSKPIIPSRHTETISDFESKWTIHPDPNVDVAVMPMGPIIHMLKEQEIEIFIRSIQQELFLKQEQLKDLSAIQEIVFSGYPDAIRDEVNLTPITRRGITATPIDEDYNDKPIFLIDASVFGGSSGSPVFILNQGSYATPKGLTMGSRVIFLGILAESHYFFEKGEMGKEKVKTKKVPVGKQYLDIGVVFKASTITETMEHWAKQNQNRL